LYWLFEILHSESMQHVRCALSRIRMATCVNK